MKSKFILAALIIGFFAGCGKVKTSNTVGDWYCEISKSLGGYSISAITKLVIKRNGPGDYEYQTETTIVDEMYGGREKSENSSGTIEKNIKNNKWRFSGGDFGERGGYIVIPDDQWDNYKPNEITVKFDPGRGNSMEFKRRGE